ncbi:BON domain-containing protein [Lysobacter sp. HA35]
MHDELLDASEILISVDSGRVLLTGEVPQRWMKHRAEDIADSVRGVAEVENRIRVDNGVASFGTGGAVRSGLNQPGSGFSSSPPNADWQPRDNRVD